MMDHLHVTDDTTSVLAKLRLSPAEIAAIARQGFVSAEQRGPRTIVFKLRFRYDGKQRVRYLGTDQTIAAHITAVLDRHQRQRQLDADLRALANRAGQTLRQSKLALVEQVEGAGLRFHGQSVRRRRQPVVQ
jgi:hypothetical protein